jgi:hypothetical protein
MPPKVARSGGDSLKPIYLIYRWGLWVAKRGERYINNIEKS